MQRDTYTMLNRIGGVAVASGVYCIYSGMVLAVSPSGTLSEPQIAWLFQYFPRWVMVVAHEVLGIALLLAVQKESRLFIAMVTSAIFFAAWALLALMPTLMGGIRGGSGLAFGFYSAAAAGAAYLAVQVRQLRRERKAHHG